VLVGDSGAMTVLGMDSTVPIALDEMLVLMRAVRRGLDASSPAPHNGPLMVGDLPFGSYEISDQQAVGSAIRLVKEAGCDAVKLEGGGPMALSRVRAIIEAGIPVMGHVGLTPQTATALGGYRAQGRDAAGAVRIVEEAISLQRLGCFALVLEAIPSQLTSLLMPRLTETVVIGIGAGPATDGQVLVFHDLLGIRDGSGGRFVKRYADLQDAMITGVTAYAEDVRAHRYPAAEHGYKMPADILAEVRARFPVES